MLPLRKSHALRTPGRRVPAVRPPAHRHAVLGVLAFLALAIVLPPAAACAFASPAHAVARPQESRPQPSRQPETVELHVEVVGIDGELLENVRALTSILKVSRSRAIRPGHVYRLADRAPEQIATALQPFGFYSPTIRSSLDTEGPRWTARYEIDPGPPTLIDRLEVRVEGAAEQDSAFQATLASLPLAAGDTLNHPAYESAKQTLGLLAADRGYFDAVWDSSLVIVDPETFTAAIVLQMTSGPRFRFGEITIDNAGWVDPDILAPSITFEPGEPYHSSYLRRLQAELSGTTYFANVEVIPRRDLADDELRVPIEVRTWPRKTQRWEVGLGYGTDTGPRIRLATEFRRLNRRGHYADLDARISTTEQSLTARYNIPVGFPAPSLWTLTGRFGNIDWVTSKSLQGILGISYSHLRGPVREVLSLRYQHDDFSVAADTAVSNLTQPIAAWTWFATDDEIYATRGAGGNLELRGAVDGIASSASFFRALTSLKTIFPVAPRIRGIVRADIGYLGTSQFNGLPPSIRFFAGGDRSIRGYEYQSLGPLDAEGQVTGGNSLVVGSVEAEYRLFKKWSVAVFLDAGNAFTDFQGDVMVGTGFGVHWISPVGLIRIDAGFGLDKEGSPFRLHLGIGPDF